MLLGPKVALDESRGYYRHLRPVFIVNIPAWQNNYRPQRVLRKLQANSISNSVLLHFLCAEVRNQSQTVITVRCEHPAREALMVTEMLGGKSYF
jgi:hypothetical protein